MYFSAYTPYLSSLLVFSVVMGLSGSDFFSVWVAMEFNMVLFIAFCFSEYKKAVGVKYFFAQAFMSSGMLLSYCHGWGGGGFLGEGLLLVFVLGKLGMPPMCGWFINVCGSCDFLALMLVTTLQKILPLYMLSMFNHVSEVWFYLVALFCFLGLVAQTYLLKILAFTSIFNTLWVILSVKNFSLCLYYYILYTFNMTVLCWYLVGSLSILRGTEVLHMNYSWSNWSGVFLAVMSAGGVPPFLGFMGKILILESNMDMFGVNVCLLLCSFLIVFVYLRHIFKALVGGGSMSVEDLQGSGEVPMLIVLMSFPVELMIL